MAQVVKILISTDTFTSHLLHFGGAEGRGQDAAHPLPRVISQEEQAVRHGLAGNNNFLRRQHTGWRPSKDRLWSVERVVPGWRRPYQPVWEAAELFHHHLPQDVWVCDHHDWLAAHVIPEISIFNRENEKKSLGFRWCD